MAKPDVLLTVQLLDKMKHPIYLLEGITNIGIAMFDCVRENVEMLQKNSDCREGGPTWWC